MKEIFPDPGIHPETYHMKLSINPFCHERPGSIYTGLTPFSNSRSRTLFKFGIVTAQGAVRAGYAVLAVILLVVSDIE
jgi:hypothetical protein